MPFADGHTSTREVVRVRNSTKTTSIANKGRRKLEFLRAVFSPGDSGGGNFVPAFAYQKSACGTFSGTAPAAGSG